MKKVACIFILFCFTAPFLGSITWYHFQKNEIRKEVKHRIKAGMTREELVLLTFSGRIVEESIRWKNDGEFEFKGQMYDVVKTEIHGDTIHYWCLWDQKESALNTRVKELVAKILGNNPQNRENQKRLITFLKTYYLPDHFEWKPDNSNKNQEYPPDSPMNCSSGFYKPVFPPPELS